MKTLLYLSFVPLMVCFAALPAAAETKTNVVISAQEVDALIKKANPKSPYPPDGVIENPHGGDLLVAALKKDPAGPWDEYILMWFAQQRYQAKALSAADRERDFKSALALLKSAREIVATREDKTDPGEKRKYVLDQFDASIALASLEAGVDLDKAKASAHDRLTQNKDVEFWDYGNIIYDANSTLGRIALREGNLDDAKKYLIAAGKTPGSPQLDSFGPDFILARALLQKNEKAVVLEFLDLVERFWAKPEKQTEANAKHVATDNLNKLQSWREQIRNGAIPHDPKWQ